MMCMELFYFFFFCFFKGKKIRPADPCISAHFLAASDQWSSEEESLSSGRVIE
jgi:hypothetical protein